MPGVLFIDSIPIISMVMKRFSILLATVAIFLASKFPALAALENRLDSLGPLIRSDPYAAVPQFLIKSHGMPHLGLPSGAGDRVQRVSDGSWYLEVKNGVARMEANYKTGDVLVRELIQVGDQWCVSPAEKLMVARRKTKTHQFVNECFDLTSGESKWTFEKSLTVMSTCFTPDGKEVVVLHKLPDPPPKIQTEALDQSTPSASAAVSWYDAQSGELTRRVEIPGISGDDRGSFMAFSGDRLYLARPGDDSGGECFVIQAGAAKPKKIEVEALANEESPRVAVGGKNGEFVVFHGDDQVALFRRDGDGDLAKLEELELESSPDGYPYESTVRFTPDGKVLAVSSCMKTTFIPTSGAGKNKEFLQGSALADFSEDGKFFITFDDGGARVWDVASWKVVRSFESKLHPPHCCPISEAGFSMSGNYIVSCDKLRLLLWSKDGQQLAELYSSRTDANQGVTMQSPIILEEQGKIYAADGFDFLVWDIAAIHKRLSRKPDNIPRVIGEVVFRDRKKANANPEVMNIRIDANGENIITATRYVVRFRPIATAAPIEVPVPENDIMMMPRIFMPGRDNSSIIVRPGFDAYTLDLTGKQKYSVLGQYVFGMDPTGTHLFSAEPSGLNSQVRTFPIGNKKESAIVASLPPGSDLRPENAIVSSDGKWIVAIPVVWGSGSLLAVMDVTKRQLIHSQPFQWTATSLSLSADGKRLLIGGSNRAVYEFDFQKMTGTP
jgi:hypothetical protein